MGNNSYYTGGWDANEYTFKNGGSQEANKTYKAINKKTNETLARKTAKNALNEINPEEIRAAIEHLIEVFQNECVDLEGLILDPSPDGKIDTALVIDGLSMQPKVNDVAAYVHFLPDSFFSTFYKTYSEAVTIYNKKQKEYNKKAKEEVENEGKSVAQAKQKNNPDYKYTIKVIEE